jgi:hypothetical protein
MKKLILSFVFIGLAVAVQAGDTKACAGKDKTACADKTACTATKVSETGCCSSMTKATTCKATAKSYAVQSPKGAEQAPRLLASR